MDWGFIISLLAILLLIVAIVLILRSAGVKKRSEVNSPDSGYPMPSESSEQTAETVSPLEEEGLYEQEELGGEETLSSSHPEAPARPKALSTIRTIS